MSRSVQDIVNGFVTELEGALNKRVAASVKEAVAGLSGGKTSVKRGRPPGKKGPGRPKAKRGPGRPAGSRGPGRPPGSKNLNSTTKAPKAPKEIKNGVAKRGPGRPLKVKPPELPVADKEHTSLADREGLEAKSLPHAVEEQHLADPDDLIPPEEVGEESLELT